MDPAGRLTGLARAIAGAGSLVVAGALVLAGCASTPAVEPIPGPTVQTSVTPSLARFYDQEITWKSCGDAQCTKITVPLDYDEPNGRTIDLAVSRMPATGEESLGSLLVNPGGPGGSAFDYAKSADFIFSDDVRDAYDIVGVDPRGVGGSAPIECLTDEQRDAMLEVDGTPDDPTEVQALVASSEVMPRECAANAPGIAEHLGTVNVARDLDIVRAVLGDDRLNYFGKSYGTRIGAVYAELFPGRVGRMVLDGVLAPDLSVEEVSLGQAIGFDEALADFGRDCSTRDDCPFTGDGPSVVRQLLAFMQKLDAEPITYNGRKLDESLGMYAVLMFLYFPPDDYDRLRDALGRLVRDRDASTMFTLLDERISRGPDGEYLDNSTDSFYAITCADNPGTFTPARAAELADQWRTPAPVYGPALAWGVLSCNGWPTPDPAVSEVSAQGSAPILVVSPLHDPATPHAWAERLVSALPNSALVTWNAHHHTAYGEGSACVDDAVDAYLLRGTMPTADLTCD